MVQIKYRVAMPFILRRKYFIAFMNIMKILGGIVLSFKVPNPAHNPTPYLEKYLLFLFQARTDRRPDNQHFLVSLVIPFYVSC